MDTRNKSGHDKSGATSSSSSWTLCPHIKSRASGQAIEAAGAERVCLPACSPDFNPIEMTFSKLKALLRKAARANHPGATVSPRQSIRSHHAELK